MSTLHIKENKIWIIPNLDTETIYKIKYLYFHNFHQNGFLYDLRKKHNVLDGWLIEHPNGDIFLKYFLAPMKTISFAKVLEQGGEKPRENIIVKRTCVANYGFIYSVYSHEETNNLFDIVFLRD